jgi:hypothetical protein
VTIAFKIYHVVVEMHPKAYNYYAIVVPDGILSLVDCGMDVLGPLP